MVAPYYDSGGITVYHGDCREILPLLTADCVVTDPPYGETSLEWDRWPDGWPGLINANSMWCCGSLRMFLENNSEFIGWRLSQDVVWRKQNGSGFATDRFRRVHEHALHWYKGAWRDVFKDAQFTMDARQKTVKHRKQPSHTGVIASKPYSTREGGPRLMTSVIEAKNCNGYAVHPTQKPVAFLSPLIEYSCPGGGLVLDPFMGSGSTLVAARDCGRRAIGIEQDEQYCEAAVKRLSQSVMFADQDC